LLLALLLLFVSLLLLASRKRQAFLLLRIPLTSWWFPLAGLSAVADVPGVTNGAVGVSAVPFEHAVTGDSAVIGFSAVEGVLADPGVHILAGGFTYWIVE
jgi:hypothetical protein